MSSLIYELVSTAAQRHNSQIAEVQDYVGRRWGAQVETRDAADVGISYE
jgi:hypothetical protein